MDKETKMLINDLCNSVIMVSQKFIKKCEDGRARSHETLYDLTLLKGEAERLKETINATSPTEA